MKNNQNEKASPFVQAYFIACQSNNFESAFKLLDNIGNVDILDPFNNYTGFIYAVSAKNYEAVRQFIRLNANVNVIAGTGTWKFTALKMLASVEFNDEIGKLFYLIWSRGGDLLLLSSGKNAISTIYENDNCGLMSILLKFNEREKILLGLSVSAVSKCLQTADKDGRILKLFKEYGLITSAQEDADNVSDVSVQETSIVNVEKDIEVMGLDAT